MTPTEAIERLRRLADSGYEGGVKARATNAHTPPSRSTWEDVANDPTEAYFRCSLPGRVVVAGGGVEWGEYAPCTPKEWFDGVVAGITP